MNHIADTARVIQLAIAPVFLLTGISALLGVLSNRLGRTIDRARVLESFNRESDHPELAILSRRARIMYRAIALGVISALLVCTLIAALFLSAFIKLDVSLMVAALFVAAMVALILTLILFLREVFLATKVLRIGPR